MTMQTFQFEKKPERIANARHHEEATYRYKVPLCDTRLFWLYSTSRHNVDEMDLPEPSSSFCVHNLRV